MKLKSKQDAAGLERSNIGITGQEDELGNIEQQKVNSGNSGNSYSGNKKL